MVLVNGPIYYLEYNLDAHKTTEVYIKVSDDLQFVQFSGRLPAVNEC